MRQVDNVLNQITMYRLVLYVLIVILVGAIAAAAAGKLAYSPGEILAATIFVTAVSWVTNKIFAVTFGAVTNEESVYITALIVALIAPPGTGFSQLMFLGWAAVLAQASKYIMAIGKKHIFNPVAIAVALTGMFAGQSANWWVGNVYLTPLVVIGGMMIVRKIRREEMIWYFLTTATLTIGGLTAAGGGNVARAINNMVFHSSLFFFAFVMLTEPLTTPPTKGLRAAYAILTGIFFAPQFHIGGIHFTPEQALLAGNVMSYLVSPKVKMVLTGASKIQIAPDIYDFVYPLKKKLKFIPGQYMEWTLGHKFPDSRGNRRYFTLASSPTEASLRIGVKFNNPSSSFKKEMLAMDGSTKIGVMGLAGDFIMPRDQKIKLALVAGGIGVTPYRSMVKYLIDSGQKRDVVILYSNRSAREIVYKDVFDQAERDLGIKVFYINTETDGHVDETKVKNMIPDFLQRRFYLSGPQGMVKGFERMLKTLKVPERQVVTDYFPGFA